MNKSVSDFIQVWFKDNNHKINYKGQFYKLNLDNEHEETYICYDKMNPLSQTANFKIVRCNQLLTWIDSQTGDIRTINKRYEENIISISYSMPCFNSKRTRS